MHFPFGLSRQERTKVTLDDETNLKRELSGALEQVMVAVSVIMSLFHVWTLGFHPVTPYYLYVAHVTFAFVLTLGLYAFSTSRHHNTIPWYDWLAIALAVATGVYLITQMNSLIYRIGIRPTRLDIVFSLILIGLILECTRRTCGNVLPILAFLFLMYARFGNYVPGLLGHRGYTWDRVITYMAGLDAVFSVPIGASASFVFLFVLFSAFLHASGAGRLFIDLATGLTGRTRGGPAKVAVVASGFFGTMSGNSVANVVGTGTFTIPMMKGIGYSPRFAGAVEAVASTGGQIMPPILGSAAFILAQLIGVPYLRVVQASIIPALLYYLAVFVMVDLEAGKNGLVGLDADKIPNVKAMMKSNGYQLIPVLVLVYVLAVMKATPMRAALWAILSVLVVSLFRKETVMGPKRIIGALDKGARDALGMVSSCATAGIVIGVLNLTGTGLKFAGAVVSLARGNVLAALVLTMIASIVLGMGLPTTAAYLITAAVAAPALVQMGISPLAAHMFVFFFACISAITPPVALAAYAGANLAGANPTEVGITATMLGSTAFIVPYMFVFGEELLWSGTVARTLQVIATSSVGVVALSIAMEGWVAGRSLSAVPRLLLLGAAFGLIDPGLLTDVIGALLIVIAWLIAKLEQRRSRLA